MKFSAKLKVSASKSATSPSCKTLYLIVVEPQKKRNNENTMLLNKVTEMSLNEKFQAVFTWKLKKPTFEVGENTTPKEELNYEMPNYSQ